eukprot:gb/GEZN01023765.1/.p2 GENE.gb/GEZN01023765.1/~~gb/GEZN01023765.1/.p2  ORF type:complete len:166 (+),score=20.84 gb/GEZN01023765.1/:19-516(+)
MPLLWMMLWWTCRTCSTTVKSKCLYPGLEMDDHAWETAVAAAAAVTQRQTTRRTTAGHIAYLRLVGGQGSLHVDIADPEFQITLEERKRLDIALERAAQMRRRYEREEVVPDDELTEFLDTDDENQFLLTFPAIARRFVRLHGGRRGGDTRRRNRRGEEEDEEKK